MADRLARMLPALAPLGDGAWVVGGAVRDDLRGVPVTDVDVAVAGDAGRAARALAAAHGAGRFRLSGAHGSWRLAGGRLPVQVDITPLQGATLGEDLSRRDFTVNAMAVPVTGRGEIVDPYGGASDLADGVLRQVSDHALDDDPVRVLRAVRLAHQHRLRVEPSTRESARRAAGRLWDAPGERLRAELVDVARLRHADRAFAEMDELGALGVLVPSLEDARGMGQNVFHHKDVLGHTLEVVTHGCDIAADPETLFRGHAARIADDLRQPVADDATRREVLVLACLLHDMAKPATREVTPEGRVTFFHHDRLGAEMATTLLKRLRMAGKVVAAVARLVRTHLVIGFAIHRQPLSMVQVDRVMGLLEPVSTEAFILSAADRMATRGPMSRDVQMARHLRLVYDLADVRDAWTLAAHAPPVLRGDQIADAMGQPPGPWLAQAVEDLRIEGIRRPGLTAERARTFIRSRAAIYGFCQ